MGFISQTFGDAATRTRLILIYGGLVLANAAAWAWAFAAFHDQPLLMGTAFLAYLFGLRHAFDADHIAAITNTASHAAAIAFTAAWRFEVA